MSDHPSPAPAPAVDPAAVAGAIGPPARALTPEAQRALDEAAHRRAAAALNAAAPHEQGGPAGPEPTRFGDWERKGIAYDF